MSEERKRPPVALMTASAAINDDCGSLKKIADAGYEVVVVRDEDFEQSLKVLEKVRLETLEAFKKVATTETCKWKHRYVNWAINPHNNIAYGPKHKFEFCPHCQKKIEVVE